MIKKAALRLGDREPEGAGTAEPADANPEAALSADGPGHCERAGSGGVSDARRG